jgi:hypothetical protein
VADVERRVATGASLSEFQTKILRRATIPDEYKLYRAALEWDLADPIVIDARTDLKSESGSLGMDDRWSRPRVHAGRGRRSGPCSLEGGQKRTR